MELDYHLLKLFENTTWVQFVNHSLDINIIAIFTMPVLLYLDGILFVLYSCFLGISDVYICSV